jgi:hypothetical protein
MTNFSINLAVLLVLLAGPVAAPKELTAQSFPPRYPTFRGLVDSGVPYPVVEGKPGQKDQGALQELRESAIACSPLDWPGIEAIGTITTGSVKNPEHWTGSLVMEKDNRLRFDMQSSTTTSSIRIHQSAGQIKRDNTSVQTFLGVQLGEYFVLPSQLWETANKPGVSVIDNGVITVDSVPMHSITIINAQFVGNSTASDFYFDLGTHYLVKSAFAGHYPHDATHRYLKVISYSDYRIVQGAAVPHLFSETTDGQSSLTFQAQSVAVATEHDKTYFHF